MVSETTSAETRAQMQIPRRKRRASVSTVPRVNRNFKKASVFSPKVHDPKIQSPSPQFDRLNLSFLSSSGTVERHNWESSLGSEAQSGDSYSHRTSSTTSDQTYSRSDSCDSNLGSKGKSHGYYSSAIEMHITASDSSLIHSRISRTNSTKTRSKSGMTHESNFGDVYFSETSIIEKGYIKEENLSKSGEKGVSGFFYASPRKYLHSSKQ